MENVEANCLIYKNKTVAKNFLIHSFTKK